MSVRHEISLSDTLYTAAKQLADRRGQNLAELIRMALIEYLERRPESLLFQPPYPTPTPITKEEDDA